MRNALLFSLVVAGSTALFAQAAGGGAASPAQPASPPSAAKPAAPTAKPAPTTAKPAQSTAKPAAQAAGRSGIALTVTDMGGMFLSGVNVDLTGPTTRAAVTNAMGQANFATLQAGTYRLRFTGSDVTPFEREVTLAAGRVTPLDISLSPAPPPREIIKEVKVEAPAPAAPPPAVGPLGTPHALSLYDMAEQELRDRQPRREVLIACSGNLRSTLVTLTTQDQPQRLYDSAEVSYYVLGGEATVKVGGKDSTLKAGGYVTIPRGTAFTIGRRGNRALSLLSVLSGEPCEEAR